MSRRIPATTRPLLAFLEAQVGRAGGRETVSRRLGKGVDWLARRLRGDTRASFDDLILIAKAAGVREHELAYELIRAAGGEPATRVAGSLIIFDEPPIGGGGRDG